MAPLLHIVFVQFRPEPIVLFTIFAVGTVGLSLYLLPRLKGALIGFQWAKGMGGFARDT
ncbi:Zinc-finger protein [Sulfitobacter guttiformis KCTC 32187]|nr:Zinc-finger protein [Sulfitobacter guttiformis KCTC 32187]